jgi:hypothetical protein
MEAASFPPSPAFSSQEEEEVSSSSSSSSSSSAAGAAVNLVSTPALPDAGDNLNKKRFFAS